MTDSIHKIPLKSEPFSLYLQSKWALSDFPESILIGPKLLKWSPRAQSHFTVYLPAAGGICVEESHNFMT